MYAPAISRASLSERTVLAGRDVFLGRRRGPLAILPFDGPAVIASIAYIFHPLSDKIDLKLMAFLDQLRQDGCQELEVALTPGSAAPDETDFSARLFPSSRSNSKRRSFENSPIDGELWQQSDPNPLSTICTRVWRLVASTESDCRLSANRQAASACSHRQCPSLRRSNPSDRRCARSIAFPTASGWPLWPL